MRLDSHSDPSPEQPALLKLATRIWEFWFVRNWPLWLLACSVLMLDLLTKSVVVGWLDWGQSWPEEGFFRFTHARNTGAAFSLFQGHSTVLSFVAMFGVGLLLWVYATAAQGSVIIKLAIGLQLGGALGNLSDRLRLGYVTDFIDVGAWPIFNIADSAISVGMVLMLYYFFFVHQENAPASTKTDNGTFINQKSVVAEGQCAVCERALQWVPCKHCENAIRHSKIP